MKRFPLLHLALVLFFAGMVVGAQFHSHSNGQDQLTAHCNSCQVSHASYDSVDANVITLSEVAFPYQAPQISRVTCLVSVDTRFGRAPPVL